MNAASITAAEVRLPGGADTGRPPVLVGRAAELDELVTAVLTPPAFVVVEGEAGIGKTRLVNELTSRDELTGRVVLRGHGRNFREAFPLGPVVEALSEAGGALDTARLSPLAGCLREVLPELSDRLPDPPPPPEDTAGRRHRRFRALSEVLAALGPAVLVVEDVHWADDTTVEYLRYLTTRPLEGLAVVVTVRPEDVDDETLPLITRAAPEIAETRVRLGPLDRDEVAALTGAMLDSPVSDEFAGWLHEQTGGVPFVVEEVLHLLRDRRDVLRTDERWRRRRLDRLEVPGAVRDAIRERLACLDDDTRETVETLAVLRAPARPGLLATVSRQSSETVRQGLAAAQRAALLEVAGGDRYGFRHALTRRSVYAAVAGSRRAELHARAAEALADTDDEPLAELAHHCKRAGLHARWLEYAEAAARTAMDAGSYTAAVDLLTDAVEAADDDTVQVRLAIMLGRAARHARAHHRVAPVVGRVLDAGGAGDREGELRLVLAQLLAQAGEATASRAQFRTAVEHLEDRPDLAAVAMAYLAIPFVVEGDLEDHLDWAYRALNTSAEAGESTDQLAVRVSVASTQAQVGHPDGWQQAARMPSASSSRSQRIEVLRLSNNLALAAYLAGAYQRAANYVQEVRDGSTELDYRRFVPVIEGTATLLEWATGRWQDLDDQTLRERLVAYRGSPSASLEIRLVQAGLLLARRHVSTAEERLAEVIQDAEAAGEIHVLLAAAGTWVRAALHRDLGVAAERARSGIRVARAKGIWLWAAPLVPWAVAALAGSGDQDAASGLIEKFAAGVDDVDAPVTHAALAHARAMAARRRGDTRRAVELFETARDAWADLPRPYEAALAAEVRARCLATADVDQGVEILQRTAETFDDLGASWDAARVRRTLREHGRDARHRRGRKGYGNRLSPREREVARLALSGDTNREIAEALFISPRTVERHIASALRKQGVSSRTDLELDDARD